jgi:hypothetical protein
VRVTWICEGVATDHRVESCSAAHSKDTPVAPASRRFTLLASILAFSFCSGAGRIPKVSLSSRLGVAVQQSGRTCLYTHNADLRAGSPLTLVLLTPPQSTIKAEVIGPSAAANCPSIDTSDATLSAYEIRVLAEGLVPSTPVIAVSGSVGQFQTKGQYVAADIGGDGHTEYFRFCASAEGIHLTVWSGRALRGKPKWHQYYYLGYDVESNCSPAETQGP